METREVRVGTREGYDRWSECYDDYGNPLIDLEEPVVRQLVGDVRGVQLLDLACGTGRHALRFA
ncbi:MAG: SAM-dependent methyltransferase, partial [Planctomycetota bacterium]